MYTQICSSLLFPLHERMKGHHSVALRRELERSQWLEPDQVAKLQAARLRGFLADIGRKVPYYAELFARERFNPDQVTSPDDLRHLPFLTKSLIRDNTDSLSSSTAGKLARYNTGGSSGEPLVFYMGMGRISHDVAAKWRATRWWDVDIGDCEVVLWGSPIEIGKQDRVKAVRDRLFRSHLLPAFQMSAPQMDRYLDEIARLRPKMLFGYASALALLARHAGERGRSMKSLGIRVAFTTGETLYPDQREVIEGVFDAPVANGYGARDAGFIAHQCPEGSLHLSAEHIVVELVGADGNPVRAGETGEIVVTHLATEDFPFLRYRTGDIAVAGDRPCKCGRGLPTLERVHGRTTDFIRTPSGNVMHALALIYEVRDKPGVRAFKFIQEKDLSLELLVVAGPEMDAKVESDMRRGLEARLGTGAAITIHRVSEIPPEKSGKYRYVVSRAAPQATAETRSP